MDKRLVAEWLRFADMDLDTAQVLLHHRPQHLEIICYHCQQAAEKHLKAYLVARGVEQPPKIHDLRKLRQLCLAFDEQFDSIADACEALTIYGVQPRYPDELFLELRHAKNAIHYAKQVKALIEKTLEENT